MESRYKSVCAPWGICATDTPSHPYRLWVPGPVPAWVAFMVTIATPSWGDTTCSCKEPPSTTIGCASLHLITTPGCTTIDCIAGRASTTVGCTTRASTAAGCRQSVAQSQVAQPPIARPQPQIAQPQVVSAHATATAGCTTAGCRRPQPQVVTPAVATARRAATAGCITGAATTAGCDTIGCNGGLPTTAGCGILLYHNPRLCHLRLQWHAAPQPQVASRASPTTVGCRRAV